VKRIFFPPRGGRRPGMTEGGGSLRTRMLTKRGGGKREKERESLSKGAQWRATSFQKGGKKGALEKKDGEGRSEKRGKTTFPTKERGGEPLKKKGPRKKGDPIFKRRGEGKGIFRCI